MGVSAARIGYTRSPFSCSAVITPDLDAGPSLADSSCPASTEGVGFSFMKGQWPLTSLCLMTRNPVITNIQYTLYEMTEPYVAELVHPKRALKTPQPLPPLKFGLQHYPGVSHQGFFAVLDMGCSR